LIRGGDTADAQQLFQHVEVLRQRDGDAHKGQRCGVVPVERRPVFHAHALHEVLRRVPEASAAVVAALLSVARLIREVQRAVHVRRVRANEGGKHGGGRVAATPCHLLRLKLFAAAAATAAA
jgi:hypothetical protein